MSPFLGKLFESSFNEVLEFTFLFESYGLFNKNELIFSEFRSEHAPKTNNIIRSALGFFRGMMKMIAVFFDSAQRMTLNF